MEGNREDTEIGKGMNLLHEPRQVMVLTHSGGGGHGKEKWTEA
jgi:hypothetical protein